LSAQVLAPGTSATSAEHSLRSKPMGCLAPPHSHRRDHVFELKPRPFDRMIPCEADQCFLFVLPLDTCDRSSWTILIESIADPGATYRHPAKNGQYVGATEK